jgi:AcrR family transcriptional regulator
MSAARTLFAERGFAAAGREEIVERAGVTRGALYHHFASKEDLFRAVYEQVESELTDATIVAAAVGVDPIEQLRLGADCFLDAPSVLDPEARRELSNRYGLGLVRAALEACEAEGRLRVGPVDALAPVVLAALHEAATSIADGADPAAVRSVVDGIIDAITTSAQ